MKITLQTIEHIRDLALLRERLSISETQTIELFDSIDCLRLEELSELYALMRKGINEEEKTFDQLVDSGKSSGFSLVDKIYENELLGSNLKSGLEILQLEQ